MRPYTQCLHGEALRLVSPRPRPLHVNLPPAVPPHPLPLPPKRKLESGPELTPHTTPAIVTPDARPLVVSITTIVTSLPYFEVRRNTKSIERRKKDAPPIGIDQATRV